jgi:hypothetical protein
VQLKDILKEKRTPREDHRWVLVLAQQDLGSPDTFNPEETGLLRVPVSSSPTLFTRSGPVGLTPIPWTEKQLQVGHFSSDAEVIAAAENWLDGRNSEYF